MEMPSGPGRESSRPPSGSWGPWALGNHYHHLKDYHHCHDLFSFYKFYRSLGSTTFQTCPSPSTLVPSGASRSVKWKTPIKDLLGHVWWALRFPDHGAAVVPTEGEACYLKSQL